MTAPLRALVAKWREHAADTTYPDGARHRSRQCADELESALAPQDGAGVDLDEVILTAQVYGRAYDEYCKYDMPMGDSEERFMDAITAALAAARADERAKVLAALREDVVTLDNHDMHQAARALEVIIITLTPEPR